MGKHGRKSDLQYPVMTGMLLLVLLIISRFGFCQTDEPFYVALAHRLWQGDLLLADEWTPVQFYGPLLLPFYALYRWIVPSGDGVLLYFRVLYVLLTLPVAALTYRWLRKKEHSMERIMPLAVSAVVMLYSTSNINGMSYYNLCFLLVLIAVICIDRKGCLTPGAGLAMAGAVLCNPYLGAAVIVLLIVLLVRQKNVRKQTSRTILVMAAAALIYVLIFLREPGRQLPAFRNMLQDTEHSSMSGRFQLVWQGLQGVITPGFLLPLTAAFAVIFLPRSIRSETRLLLQKLTLLSMIIFGFGPMLFAVDTSSVIIAVSLMGLPVMLQLFREHWLEREIVLLYGAGLITALGFMIASNIGVDTMCCGLVLCAMATVWAVGLQWTREEEAYHSLADALSIPFQSRRPERNNGIWTGMTLSTLMAVFVAIFLPISMYAHREMVYQDGPIGEMGVQITTGPARGLMTTERHARETEEICQLIREVCEAYPEERVMHSMLLPWAYLCADNSYGVPMEWRLENSREEEYIAWDPANQPGLVFLYGEEVGAWESHPLSRQASNPAPNRNPEGVPAFLQTGEYEILRETELVTVYHRVAIE